MQVSARPLHSSSLDMAHRLLAGSTFFCLCALFYYGPLRTERVHLSYLFARSKWPPRYVRYACAHTTLFQKHLNGSHITRVCAAHEHFVNVG